MWDIISSTIINYQIALNVDLGEKGIANKGIVGRVIVTPVVFEPVSSTNEDESTNLDRLLRGWAAI